MPEKRFWRHLRDACKSALQTEPIRVKDGWLMEMLTEGRVPVMEILEKLPANTSKKDAHKRETEVIAQWRGEGWELTNYLSVIIRLTQEELYESRVRSAAIARSGIADPKESLYKNGWGNPKAREKLLAKIRSPEANKRRAEKRRVILETKRQAGIPIGRPQSQDVREKISNSLRGRPKTAAHRANAKAALQRPEVKNKHQIATDRNRKPCPICGRMIPPGAARITHERACLRIQTGEQRVCDKCGKKVGGGPLQLQQHQRSMRCKPERDVEV